MGLSLSIPEGTVVTVETKYFPPLVIGLTAERQPGLGGMLTDKVTQLLKPKVTLTLQGTKLGSLAPQGEPVPNQWGVTKVVLAVAVGLAVFGLLRVLGR